MRNLPLKSLYPMGRIIYYALHQSPAHAIQERKMLLAHYLRLNVERISLPIRGSGSRYMAGK